MDEKPELSARELEVLHGMSRGLSNTQIARELYLSPETVKTHARRLFQKLDVHDRSEAVASGLSLGLMV